MVWHDIPQVTLVNKKQHLVTSGMAWFPISNMDRVSPEKRSFYLLLCPCYRVWNKIITKATKITENIAIVL